ncbi:MAG: hypothetical protein KDK56_04520, partial [Simkania sp.]|nr:hypothetical protein [Simkania sp.]
TALLNEARKKATIFLENHSLTNLALLDLPYNYSLFKQKELAGKVHLPPLNSHFIGRENELQALKKALIKKDYQEKTAEVSLVADRGYGKSELALAFAFLNLEAFSLTWTLDFRNPESLETSYRKLAKTLKISTNALALQDIQAKVHTKLENAEEPWLLIFDNVDQGFIPSYPKKGGALLFTSSHPHTFDSKSPLHLSKLAEGEALVKKILDKNDPELPHLAQDLRGIPLLLQQAASYIQESQITISEYRTLLSQASPKPLEKQTYEELLKTTWAIASTSLQTHLKEAYNWLIMSSFLDTKNIPKNWLDTFLTNQPSLKSHLKSQEILNFLKNYGLISFYKYDTTFSLHGYFQQIIRPEADKPLQAHLPFLLNLQEIKDYNPTKPEAAQAFQKIVHHTAEVLSHLKTPSKEASRLGLTLVRYLLETPRDLDKGEAYLNLTKSLTPPNHPAQGRLAFFAGELAKKKAQDAPAEEKETLYKQALENFTNAHAIFSNNYPQEDYLHLEQNPDKCNPPYQRAICLEYQGQMLLRLGKLKQAKQKLKQANQELKTLHPSGEHFDIARIKREQGNILLQQGDRAGAITKIQKALELQKKVYKERFESHSTVAATYSALAEAHLTQEEKDLEQADTCYQIAITTNEKAYKTENHPYIARLYGKRAEIAQALGKTEEAEAFKKKQQEIKEAIERNKAES